MFAINIYLSSYIALGRIYEWPKTINNTQTQEGVQTFQKVIKGILSSKQNIFIIDRFIERYAQK